MKNHLHLSIASGLIGMMVGASSMYVVQASVIKRALRPGAPIERSTTRAIREQGMLNVADRGERTGVNKGTNAIR